jgi:YVTN family beta-propeller protein
MRGETIHGVRQARWGKYLLMILPLLAGQSTVGAQGDHGYAAMSGGDTLVVFDLATGTALPPAINLLPEGDYPYDATLDPLGNELWIVGASGDGVVVVDTATDTVVARIPLGASGEYPVDVVFGAGGDLAYVSARDSDAMVVIDVATHTMTGTSIPIASDYLGPGKMTVNSVTGEIYLVEWYDDQLYVIDPVTHAVTPETIGTSLWDLTIDGSASTLYLADRGTDQIRVVNVADLSVVTSISVGDDPWSLDLTPDGKYLFVANEDSHDVSVIDTVTNAVVETIPLAGDADPRDVDVSADGSSAYVPSGVITGDDGVYVIDVATFTVVGTIPMLGETNTNVVAVAPNLGIWLFTDGFESGDTSAWSATVP